MATAFDDAFNAGGFGGSEQMPEAQAPAPTSFAPVVPGSTTPDGTWIPDGPRLPSSGRAGFNSGTTDLPPAPIDLGPVQAPPAAQVTPTIAPPQNAPSDPTANVHRASQDVTQRLGLRAAVSHYTGAGADTRSQEEIDMRTLSFAEQDAKYGHDQAMQMRLAMAGGEREWANYMIRSARPRPNSTVLGDSAIDVGNAFVGGLASLGSLAAGATIDPLLGTNVGPWSARQIEAGTEWTQGFQSQRLQDHRMLSEIRSSLDQEVNDAQFERERATHGDLTAHMRRMGRGIVDGTLNTLRDPVNLTSGIASGVGSLLGAGPVAAGLRRLGAAALSTALGRSVAGSVEASAAGGSRASRLLLDAAEEAPMVASIGAQEAGGAYTGTVSEIQNMNFQDLARTSQEFRNLTARGVPPEDARNQIANRAGLTAAAIQGPIGAATGTLVSRFEGAPLRVPTLRSAGGNVLRETVEEFGQSGGGAFAQNVGVAQSADPSRSLSQGVGEQGAQGAIYGAGTAGALQAPGASARAAGMGARAIGNAVLGAAEGVADTLDAKVTQNRERNEASNPISETNVRAEAQTVSQQAPEAVQAAQTVVAANTNLTSEQQASAQAFIDRVAKADALDPAMTDDPVVRGATGQVDALYRVARALQASKNEDEQVALARMLLRLNQGVDDLMDVDPDTMKGILPDDHPILGVMNRFQDLVPKIQASPVINRAMGRALGVVDTAQVKVTSPQIDTSIQQGNTAPTGAAQNTIEQAQRNPSQNSLEAVQRVSYHAQQGNLVLTPAQQQALDNSERILKAAKKASDAAKAAGHTKVMGNIADRVLVEEKGNRIFERSAARHSTDVVTAMAKGDTDLAQDFLEDMGKFVTHMSNKVGAINKHFELGPNASKQPSMSLQPDRTFKEEGLWGVTPTSAGSIEFVQQVDLETQALAEIYNGLVEAFPQLNQEKITPTSIPQVLKGDIKTVAAGFRTGTRTNKPEAEAKVVSRITPEQAAKLTDEGLNAHIEAIEKKMAYLDETDEDIATFEVLDAEMNKRKSAAAEAEAAAKAAAEAAAAAEATTTTPKTVAEAYPNLLGTEGTSKQTNVFVDSFKIPKTIKSRLLGSGSPLKLVRELLSSNSAFTKTTGDNTPAYKLNADVVSDYKSFLALVPTLVGKLNETLDSKLNSVRTRRRGPDGKLEPVPEGEQVSRWELMTAGKLSLTDFHEGRSLNITEVGPDGKVTYNQELIEGAVLAAMQWMLDNRNGTGNQDTESLAKSLGIDEDALSEGDVNFLNSGIPMTTAIRSLASKIDSYWGLDPNNDASIENIDGVPESVAAVIIEVLSGIGAVSLTTRTISLDGTVSEDLNDDSFIDNEEQGSKTYNIFNVKLPSWMFDDKGQESSAVFQVPTAIEQVTVTERPEISFIGEGNAPKARERQHRNPMVFNTKQQQDTLTLANNVKFFPDMPMLTFFQRLTEKGFTAFFGFGDITNKTLNKLDRLSQDGKNRSVISAYRSIMGRVEELKNIVGEDPWNTIPMFYEHNMLRNGRMMMLQPFSPQASKEVREVFISTWSNLDLSGSNMEHRAFFRMALAQALNVKIAKTQPDEINRQLDEKLAQLQPIIDMLKDMNDPNAELDPDFVEVVKNTFKKAKVPLAPVAIHALMEQARLEEAQDRGETEFTTSIYIEADGVTNGVVNAMAMFTSGEFTPDFIRNMAKGGRALDTESVKNLADQYAKDPNDLYMTAKKLFEKALDKFIESHPTKSEVRNQAVLAKGLMTVLMEDMEFVKDDQGRTVASIGRGILKNPLTVILYGSSPRGIANKFTKLLSSSLYAVMSDIAQANARGEDLSETLFLEKAKGNVELAQTYYRVFQQALPQLTTYRTKKDFETGALSIKKMVKPFLNKDGTQQRDSNGKIKWNVLAPPNFDDPENLRLKPGHLKALQSNVLHLFVGPMMQGINEVIGNSVIENMALLREATQVHSIVYEHKFNEAVEAQREKNKNDPKWVGRATYPSPNQMKQIALSLEKYAPVAKTGDQNFLITRTENINSDTHFGSTIGGKFAVVGQVQGFRNAGVSGLAMLNQGMGDGAMIQNAVLDPRAPKNSIYIYDGIHYSVEMVRQGSEVANKAAYDSWQNNPLKVVGEMFTPLMGVLTIHDITPVMLPEMTRAFGGDPRDPWSAETIFRKMNELAPIVETQAKLVSINHGVMKNVRQGIDQMAGAARPYTTPGTKTLSGTPEEMAKALETARLEAMGKALPVKPSKAPASKISVLSVTSSLPLIIEAFASKLSSGQLSVLREIRRSMGAKGYKIVSGTPEQIAEWQIATGREPVPMRSTDKGVIHGATTYNDKVIYIVSATGETIIHELVHASTFEKIQAYYEGKPTDLIVKEAIRALEAQMEQFLSLDPAQVDMDFTTRQAFFNAKTAIEGSTSKTGKLNEFMSWVLANKALGDLTADTKKVSFLGQLVREALIALKKIIFGRKHLPKPGEDFFSNLLFNSSIIMRSQPTVVQMSADTASYMSTAYGTSDRLVELQKAFDELIVQFIGRGKNDLDIDTRADIATNAALDAKLMADELIANAFPNMTMQEKTLFTSIVTALNVDMLRDPTSVAAMEKVYRHVMKNLPSEDPFMVDPVANDPNDRDQANRKLNALRGEYTPGEDQRKRSFLLPVFFGLAATNDQFRDVLSKIPMPVASIGKGSSMDEVAGNLANSMMARLSNWISGADPKAANANAAMDTLMYAIQTQIQQRQGFIEQLSNPVGSGIDTLNNRAVQGIEYASTKVSDLAKGIKAKVSNKWAKRGAELVSMAAQLATEKGAANVAEGISSLMNRTHKGVSYREFLANVIGRTESNKGVYDQMKVVKTEAQKTRQQFREQVPLHIAAEFSRSVADHEYSSMFRGFGKTDIAALAEAFGRDEILDLMLHAGRINGKITSLENDIRAADPGHFSLVQAKAKQLANHMNTGHSGDNLLRNARAVSELLNENKAKNRPSPSPTYVAQVDQLISLYALDGLSSGDKKVLRTLVQTERKGMNFVLAYLQGQRKEEVAKAQDMAYYNSFKGYVPSEQQPGVSMIVANDSDGPMLMEKSYVRVGNYNGSRAERHRSSRGYYFAPVNGRAPFEQGIFQTVRPTSGGVDISTGLSHNGLTAGVIRDTQEVLDITRARSRNNGPKENLQPVFDNKGQIIAYERSLDPSMLTKLNHDTHMGRMMGVWRGRQVEENRAQELNEVLVEKLHEMYVRDKTARPLSVNQEYVNVFAPGYRDPVLGNALNLINSKTLKHANEVFGGKDEFWVRRDMLNDSFGYHRASVGDVWTGNSRWSPATQKVVKDLAVSMFGNKGYQYLTMTEDVVQKVVKEAKMFIVIKSVVVPYANAMSNIFHLISRGVPIREIVRNMPRKLAEIDFYAKSLIEEQRLEANLLAASDDPFETKKLEAQLTSIRDSQKRLTIWPLIERGEFSSITDAGLTEDDLILTGRNITGYMEKLTDKLPDAMKNAGRQALITKDTALFQGLQKAVAYGDFVAKAIFYDDLITRQGKDPEYANGVITEEFVNYDVLPGRTRGYLENMGLLWFWNFKIRYSKIALSVLRNNPVHAFLSTLIPLPDILSSGVNMGFEGSIFEKLGDGSIRNSIGFSQGLHAPMMHPFVNLIR